MTFHAYVFLQNNIAVQNVFRFIHTVHTQNVTKNLTFLTPRYKYVCVHIGAGGGVRGKKRYFFKVFYVHIITTPLLLKLFLH